MGDLLIFSSLPTSGAAVVTLICVGDLALLCSALLCYLLCPPPPHPPWLLTKAGTRAYAYPARALPVCPTVATTARHSAGRGGLGAETGAIEI